MLHTSNSPDLLGIILCKPIPVTFAHGHIQTNSRSSTNRADGTISYSEQQLRAIQVAHRECQNWSDWVALSMVRILRWGMDTATGYRHVKDVAQGKEDGTRRSWFDMTERKWLTRFVFLESVAGVPGMVGGMLRHLHSLRRMKRDNGW